MQANGDDHEYRQTQRLIDLFDALFFSQENTRLTRGEHEPLYMPAHMHEPGPESVPRALLSSHRPCPYHRIFFANGYFSSALHELAHWCIAGAERREKMDYGYWYSSDGRDRSEQQAFERMEVTPQALEWIFSVAAAHPFRISLDNINAPLGDSRAFVEAVSDRVRRFLNQGLPPRAQCLATAMRTAWRGPDYMQWEHYPKFFR